MGKGRRKKRSLAAFGMEEDTSVRDSCQEDPDSGGWETAAMDTGDAAGEGVGEGTERAKRQRATRGNRTKRQKKRQVAGLEKALAVSERSIARVKKVEKKTLKRKSLKNLWESSRASDAASA